MNDFESTLVAALRVEAEEVAMSVDDQHAIRELESRLDHVERSRHRRYWAAAALVVLVVGAAAFVVGRPSDSAGPVIPGTSQTSVAPSPATTYTSVGFAVPFTVTLPPWMSVAALDTVDTHPNGVYWDADRCWVDRPFACRNGYPGVRFASPVGIYQPGEAGQQPVPGYAKYVDFITSLESTAGLVHSDRVSTTVDGHRATLITLNPTRDVHDAAFACDRADESANDCWFPGLGWRLELAVVDIGRTPLDIWVAGNTRDQAAWAALSSDFRAMLDTVHLDATASPAGTG